MKIKMKYLKTFFSLVYIPLLILTAIFGGVIFILVLVLGISILVPVESNTYNFSVTPEDRIAQGIYIPSKHRASTKRVIAKIKGSFYQDCQLVIVTTRTDPNVVTRSSTAITFFPRGEIKKDTMCVVDSYQDDNASIIIRPLRNNDEPIGDLKIEVRHL